MQAQVEELSDNKVRLTVDVPKEDVQHAVEHATSDLADSVKVPGFRRGKVPKQVLQARIGRDRLMTEAVESHIGSWFWNAAANTRIRPVAQPEYDYDVPESADDPFTFKATVAVQPKPEVVDWTTLEVPYEEPEVAEELIDQALEAIRATAAEFSPVERGAQIDDVLLLDLETDEEIQRDYVVELGARRLLDEIEAALVGARAGETKEVEFALPDGEKRTARAVVKEVQEPVLPPLDDELAKKATEFETFEELRADVKRTLLDQLEEEAETRFRAAAADALVAASRVEASGPLVETRARELLSGLGRSLDRRGISAETYLQLSGLTAEQLMESLRAEAARAVGRELVLEAVADKLELDVSDEEVDELIREQAEAAGDDPDWAIGELRESGRDELLRQDLRLRNALDRIVSEVKRISPDVARARDKLWTPDKESAATETKLWTPGQKEPA
jgi:trigger factor